MSPPAAYASSTVFPPTTVRTIVMSLIVSASIVCGSSESTTKSAAYPVVIEPLMFSSFDAYAPWIVFTRMASSTLIC